MEEWSVDCSMLAWPLSYLSAERGLGLSDSPDGTVIDVIGLLYLLPPLAAPSCQQLENISDIVVVEWVY